MTISLGTVEIEALPPVIPTFESAPPSPTEQVIIPVPGVPGQSGAPGGSRFVHTQTAPAATWMVVHNLGRKPPVVLELASDPTELVYTDIYYPDLNTVVVEWSEPETGKVYI